MSSSIKLKLEVKSTDEQVAKFISATNDVHITFAPDYYSNIEYTSIGAQMYSNIEATIGVLNSNQENQTIMTIGNSNIQMLKDTLVRGNLVVDGHIISLGIDVAVSQQDLFISADHTNNKVFYENVFSNVVLQKYDELENNMLSSTSNNITNFISNEYNTLYNEGCNLINGSLEFQDFFSTDNIYSSEKFDTRFATKTADNIANGSNNKFIVNDKFNQNQFIIQGDISAHNLYTSGNAFVSGAVSSYQYYADGSKLRNIFPGDGTTDSIIEGSNLFFKSSYVADITDASNLDTSNLASSIFGENLQSILLDKSISLSNYSFDTSNNVSYELNNLYGNLSNMMDFHYIPFVQRLHLIDGARDQIFRRPAKLDRRSDNAGAKGFREDQPVAFLGDLDIVVGDGFDVLNRGAVVESRIDFAARCVFHRRLGGHRAHDLLDHIELGISRTDLESQQQGANGKTCKNQEAGESDTAL